MKNAVKSDERLRMIAYLVRRDSRVLDIGTDHAYLPVFLVESGRCPCAVASDVVDGPVENARKTVERYSLSDKIKVFRSDGFDSVPEGCADDVIIAGMGGTLSVELLSRCEWIKSVGVRLILQPMTHHENVRMFLCENGFVIKEETACFYDGRVYAAIAAEYCGEKAEYPLSYFYIGELSKSTYNREAATAFLNRKLMLLNERKNALEKCKRNLQEFETLCEVTKDIESILEGRT